MTITPEDGLKAKVDDDILKVGMVGRILGHAENNISKMDVAPSKMDVAPSKMDVVTWTSEWNGMYGLDLRVEDLC